MVIYVELVYGGGYVVDVVGVGGVEVVDYMVVDCVEFFIEGMYFGSIQGMVGSVGYGRCFQRFRVRLVVGVFMQICIGCVDLDCRLLVCRWWVVLLMWLQLQVLQMFMW